MNDNKERGIKIIQIGQPGLTAISAAIALPCDKVISLEEAIKNDSEENLLPWNDVNVLKDEINMVIKSQKSFDENILITEEGCQETPPLGRSSEQHKRILNLNKNKGFFRK